MTFTVADFQDLIRLLGEHPEWRTELRRHVLSDELVDLPTVVGQLAEQMATLTTRVDQFAQQTEQRFNRLESVLEQLIEAQGRTETRVGRLEGEVLELRYARRAPAYFSRLARRLRVLDPGRLADQLDEAVASGRIADAEREALLEADLVLTGRRREDDAEVYLLAEISATIDPHDVDRAADRAAMLEKLGRPVVPIVAGWRINDEALTLATERGVWQTLDGRIIPPRWA